MKKQNNTEKKLNDIYSIMENLSDADRELLSDKIIAYLLFNVHQNGNAQKKIAENRKAEFTGTELSKREKSVLKKIVDRTEELKNLLGDAPLPFC